jgi:hypothetical protein
MNEVAMSDEIPSIPINEDVVEFLQASDKSKEDAWFRAVWEHYGGKCGNCGSDQNIAVRMIVPEAAGGKAVLTNGHVICRTCEVAQTAVRKAEEHGIIPKRPICVWVSRKLYDTIQEALQSKNGFNSMAGLTRYMMKLLVEHPERFSDLENYQDRGSDLKINLWVDAEDYDRFKSVLSDRNLTVTDGIKGLMLLYTTESAPSARR